MNDLIILKSGEELTAQQEEIKILLERISKRAFWQKHFFNKNFTFEPAKFNWTYWRTIPLFSKKDFFAIGIEKRLEDNMTAFGVNSYRYILRTTSGTTGLSEPVLFLNMVTKAPISMARSLRLSGSFSHNLRGVLAQILASRIAKKDYDKYQSLIILPNRLNPAMASALEDFGTESIFAFPTHATALSSMFLKAGKILKEVKRFELTGDFVSTAQLNIMQKFLRQQGGVVNVASNYASTELGSIGISCPELRERYGLNAYHPARNAIIEIADLDENGYGEIIGTKLPSPDLPRGLAMLRYRTGDIALPLEEFCKCGAIWMFFLAGRKNFDYIKCGGTMIIRKELERVLALSDIQDVIETWEGEAREIEQGGNVLGELTLRIKLSADANKRNPEDFLKSSVSKNLFLTPTETLDDLVAKRKFMPLRLEFVTAFPENQKRLVLKKIS